MTLTAKSVALAKPGNSRREIPDGKLAGLYLVVQPSGAKSWAYRYRLNGKPAKLTLGPVYVANGQHDEPSAAVVGAANTLAGARALAAEAARKVARGVDPAVERKEQKRAQDEKAERAALAGRDTVEAVAKRFLGEYVKNLRPATRDQYHRIITKIILPRWKSRTLHSIDRRDVKALIAAVKASGRPVMANRTFAVVSSLYGWAAEVDITTTPSPCIGVRPRRKRGSDASPGAGLMIKEQSRERSLSDDEAYLVWKAAGPIGWPFGPFVKLLLLTGARRNEVAGMEWSELDLAAKVWNLPATRSKNGRAHTIPLSDQAVCVLQSLPRVGDRYVLTTNGDRPISGFGRAKERIDAEIWRLQQDEVAGRDASPLPHWTLHDLRRTVASGLGALGFSGETIERVLNHRSGKFAGIAGIYQRHRYEQEGRTALAAWARHVAALVTGETDGNVIEIAVRAR